LIGEDSPYNQPLFVTNVVWKCTDLLSGRRGRRAAPKISMISRMCWYCPVIIVYVIVKTAIFKGKLTGSKLG
jgi:hypothetical protein